MSWAFVDIPRVRTIDLPTPAAVGQVRDFVWQGIRKGGERWWALQNDDLLGWTLSTWRPEPGSNQPFTITGLEVPAAPGNWNPLGLTTDKKTFCISSRDITGATPDRLSFYDVQGNLLRSPICSDAPDRDNSRLTFLEHDYYVLSQSGGDQPWFIKVYDARAELIRSFNIAITNVDSPRGITTDGKYLYVLIVRPSNPAFDRILKIDVRGTQIDSSWSAGDGRVYLNGITFNGHYLIVQVDEAVP